MQVKICQSYAKGRYFHQLILEPEKALETIFVDASTRATKIYKEAVEELNLGFILLNKEGEEIRGCVDNMIQNFEFFEGWINIDIKQAKNGNYYCELDTYEPVAKEEY
jgi:hypothetical protein